jgi:hypothetical protein
MGGKAVGLTLDHPGSRQQAVSPYLAAAGSFRGARRTRPDMLLLMTALLLLMTALLLKVCIVWTSAMCQDKRRG